MSGEKFFGSLPSAEQVRAKLYSAVSNQTKALTSTISAGVQSITNPIGQGLSQLGVLPQQGTDSFRKQQLVADATTVFLAGTLRYEVSEKNSIDNHEIVAAAARNRVEEQVNKGKTDVSDIVNTAAKAWNPGDSGMSQKVQENLSKGPDQKMAATILNTASLTPTTQIGSQALGEKTTTDYAHVNAMDTKRPPEYHNNLDNRIDYQAQDGDRISAGTDKEREKFIQKKNNIPVGQGIQVA